MGSEISISTPGSGCGVKVEKPQSSQELLWCVADFSTHLLPMEQKLTLTKCKTASEQERQRQTDRLSFQLSSNPAALPEHFQCTLEALHHISHKRA